jgi:hypothetical protein
MTPFGEVIEDANTKIVIKKEDTDDELGANEVKES